MLSLKEINEIEEKITEYPWESRESIFSLCRTARELYTDIEKYQRRENCHCKQIEEYENELKKLKKEDVKNFGKPRAKFCWVCGRKLRGNHFIEKRIDEHLRICHKSCGED